MTMASKDDTSNKLDTLKLQVAKPVKHVPTIGRSAIDSLPQFQDAAAIIMAVKEGADPADRQWLIFDKQDVTSRVAKLRNYSQLAAAFCVKVRRFIEKQGVERYVRVEQRKEKLYLVGIEQPQEK